MTKTFLLSIIVSLIVLWAISCGGGAATPSAPTSPSSPSGPSTPEPQSQAPPSTTINIVSSTGSGAFSPNPVQVPSGGTIVWRNTTSVGHVLVMNDGTPIGSLAPAASLTTTLSGNGGNFHCTTHPSMVGSINGSATPAPPSDDDGY